MSEGKSSQLPGIVWFRSDLRVEDNPALLAAADAGPILPLFLWSPEDEGDWPPGAASRWWLHHSLARLSERLAALGAPLLIRSGDTLETLLETIRATGAKRVYWNRRYEPASIARDKAVKERLAAEGVEAHSFNASLLNEPWKIETQSGGPYQVYTPYWKASRKLDEPAKPSPGPSALVTCQHDIEGEEPASFELLPKEDWAGGIAEAWAPGEDGAGKLLKRFIEDAARDYAESRNRPDQPGTSRLSPHLHFGEISPRQVWHALRDAFGGNDDGEPPWPYLRQLVWRDFGHHLLYHFPHTAEEPLRESFKEFPWVDDPDALKKWQQGKTGYPIVDAGMRELWTTGWMHNRVRMIAASFLVKDLLIPWQEGAKWFWDTLVDADLANNTLGWQWTAGCGADAAPYFRVFNPVSQGERFDPQGEYVRRWVPELGKLPKSAIHRPWEASPLELDEAGVRLGRDYPEPMVEHAEARKRALEAWARVK